jgi:hypothetical protein
MSAAPSGAGRNDNIHGDEHLVLDVESFQARALADVVECITMYGQWPQPRQPWDKRPQRRVEFSLNEYLVEEWDASDLARFIEQCLGKSPADFMDDRAAFETHLQRKLKEHLEDSQIVRDHAEKLAQDDHDDKGGA